MQVSDETQVDIDENVEEIAEDMDLASILAEENMTVPVREPEPEPEPEPTPAPAASNVDSDALQAEVDTLRTRNEQLMRVAADFENYKRRQERERTEMAKFAGQQVISNLLPVIDNFERALQTEPKAEELENFIDGVKMIHKQFLDVLGKAGVEAIEAMGQRFNPEFHEAIMQEENTEVPDETVIGEFQTGYAMHGRLLRPSIVKVSRV